jgi:hypothetical protein
MVIQSMHFCRESRENAKKKTHHSLDSFTLMQVSTGLLVAAVEQQHRGHHNAAVAAVEDLEPENSSTTAAWAHKILVITAWCRERILDVTPSGTCHVDGTLETRLQKVMASLASSDRCLKPLSKNSRTLSHQSHERPFFLAFRQKTKGPSKTAPT